MVGTVSAETTHANCTPLVCVRMDVYGLIGSPVEHSLSPPMHEAAYDACGMDARYVTFEPDADALESALTGADALGIDGLNVTIPFKQDVFEYVEPADVANQVGAINTIDFSTSPPTGYNTDVAGVRRTFEHHEVSLGDSKAVVIGAGGAGRAVAFALTQAGATVHILNRTAEKAENLAAELSRATGKGLDAIPELLESADVLINATSVGMDEDATPVPADHLHSELVVFDAVYSPLETRLLREARAAGAMTIDGAWMLLFQGVEAFEHWTDSEAPVDAMNEALRDHL